jgi:hypothetical protein
MSRPAQFALVTGILLIVAIAACAIVNTLQNMLQPLASAPNALETQVAVVLPQPTPTIYPAKTTVIQSVRTLARLETVQYSIEKVIVAEEGQESPLAFFVGDRLLLVAHGTVIAGVDLAKLQENDVTVLEDGRVYLTVPSAEVFVATLDNDKTYVYDRQTGLFSKGDVNLETAARQAAEVQIRQAALEDGVLTRAQDNANTTLQKLLLSLGFREVIVVVATPNQ